MNQPTIINSNIKKSRAVEAFDDLHQAILHYNLWFALAVQDVRGRYRRSTLGPFWLTISMAIMIAGMGPLYGSLFRQDLSKFIPYLAIGWIMWAFIAGLVNDFVEAFSGSSSYLRNMKLPLSLFILRVIARHLLMLAHNVIILIMVYIFSDIKVTWNLLLFIPNLVLVVSELFFLGTIIAIFCARYRDMAPVVNNLVQVLFFITPIVWHADQLPPTRQFFVEINPVYYLLELLRLPLMGITPSAVFYNVTIVILGLTAAVAYFILTRYRHRVSYWL